MLVLTRKTGERLVLTIGGHRVTIGILAMARGRAQIGIDAPRQISVLREELVGTGCVEKTPDVGTSPRRA
ncbi:MAG: carbon storage regulator [Pirellulales bacterium]